MLLLDLTHPSHTRAHTGIQRVARALHTELAARGVALAVTWDAYARAWRPLETWESANLAKTTAGAKRGARWPLTAKLRGLLRRRLGRARNRCRWPRGPLGHALTTLDDANIATLRTFHCD